MPNPNTDPAEFAQLDFVPPDAAATASATGNFVKSAPWSSYDQLAAADGFTLDRAPSEPKQISPLDALRALSGESGNPADAALNAGLDRLSSTANSQAPAMGATSPPPTSNEDDLNEFDKQSDAFDSAARSAAVYISILGKPLSAFQSSYLNASLQAVVQSGVSLDDGVIRDIAGRAADLPGLGSVSARFETGGRGPGTISTGAGGDRGGVSYGSYQMASNFGVPQDFLKNEGAPWADKFTVMDVTSSTGSFAQTWRAIAAAEPDTFGQAQQDYIARDKYAPVLAMANLLGFSTSDVGVQNALWSQSVQSGLNGNMNIFQRFMTTNGGNPVFMSPEQQIEGLYAARGDYTSSIPIRPPSAGVPRYNVEMPIAVQLSKNFPVGP